MLGVTGMVCATAIALTAMLLDGVTGTTIALACAIAVAGLGGYELKGFRNGGA